VDEITGKEVGTVELLGTGRQEEWPPTVSVNDTVIFLVSESICDSIKYIAKN
jgi:hypothetical protein